MTTDHKTIDGRYRLGTPLGHGGMAEVRLGLDLKLCRPVAVKRLRDCLAGDPAYQTRFQDEARSVASLSHPNIVAIYDTGEDADPVTGVRVPYLVMELVTGRTLKALLAEEHRLAPERALPMVQGVLAALAHSHAAGIVHQDVKPSNVMVTPDDQVKVMDFGIARRLTDAVAAPGPGFVVLGTAKYLAPERARGLAADARSDLYSAGCLLYETLVGAAPFAGDTPADIAACHLRDVPVPPSERVDGIAPELDAVVLRALAKDPAARFSSAAEMSLALGTVLASLASPGRPAAPAVAPVVALPTLPPVPACGVHRRGTRVDRRGGRRAGVAPTPDPGGCRRRPDVPGRGHGGLRPPPSGQRRRPGGGRGARARSRRGPGARGRGRAAGAHCQRDRADRRRGEDVRTGVWCPGSSRPAGVEPRRPTRTASTAGGGTASKPSVRTVSAGGETAAERAPSTAAAKPRPRSTASSAPARSAAPAPSRTGHQSSPAPRTPAPRDRPHPEHPYQGAGPAARAGGQAGARPTGDQGPGR